MAARRQISKPRVRKRCSGPWNAAHARVGLRVSLRATGRRVMSETTQQAPSGKPFIKVAAGLILQPDGQLLLAQRPEGKPWAGWWELPGGKIEAGETTLQALAREREEELGIKVTDASPWVTYTHEYPKNIVELSFCRVYGWTGTPAGLENQALAWVDPKAALPVGPLLPATEPPMRWLQLPEQYLVTSIGSQAGLAPYLEKLALVLQQGIELVQFREPAWASASEAETYAAFQRIVQICHDAGVRCLVNSCHPESWWAQADGVHFRAADAATAAAKENVSGLTGVSEPNANEHATQPALGDDFAGTGPLL